MSRLSLSDGVVRLVSVTTEAEPHPVDFLEEDACRMLLTHRPLLNACAWMLPLVRMVVKNAKEVRVTDTSGMERQLAAATEAFALAKAL